LPGGPGLPNVVADPVKSVKKVALVFVLAVFVPASLLAWLAVRSLRDQQLVVERQATLLAEETAERLVRQLGEQLTALRAEFTNHTERLLGPPPAAGNERLADFAPVRGSFDEQLRAAWAPAAVGFAVSFAGECYSPSMFSSAEARSFRLANELFLCNRESVEVVWNGPKGRIPLRDLEQGVQKSQAVFANNGQSGQMMPSTPATGRSFRDLIGSDREGAVSRFVDDRLQLLLWYRPPANPFLVFGAQLRPEALRERLGAALRLEPAVAAEFAAVLWDDDRQPVGTAPTAFGTAGRRALAAAEVGDVLPHWRVAVFATDPARLSAAAVTARLTLGLLVLVLLLAIGAGSWLIVADLRRQLALARQKTDFVSNVSHELKTPLTSIRMFAELLAEERVTEPEKRRQFLGIIGAEAARLTRLINNVLDFARLERGEHRCELRELDLREPVREAAAACRPPLEAAGVQLEVALPPDAVTVRGNHDALVQVLVNLLSNVEKYAAAGRRAEVALAVRGSAAVIEVADRGPGVPPGCEGRVFEQFFRGHDSLASGIQGSGLGLTLARQLVRAQGGEVECAQREGGGSRFLVRLPHSASTAASST